MNAPDKIYVHVRKEPRPSITFSEVLEENSSNVEYIRKDALLEWVTEKKERLGKMFDAMPATAIGAKLDACKEFIDKIESL